MIFKAIANKLKIKFQDFLFYESVRKRILMSIATIILCLISSLMTVVNFITKEQILIRATGLFSIVLFIVFIITIRYNNELIPEIILAISIVALFSYFLVYGGVEGFSPIWMMLLPSTALTIYGLKKGLYLCFFVLLISIVLLWTPGIEFVKFDYSNAFIGRFPMALLSSIVIATALEYERFLIFKKLSESRTMYERSSKIDELTKLKNRRGFNAKLHQVCEQLCKADADLSIIMIDIDFFKLYNDHYGHIVADGVLAEVADIIKSTASTTSNIVARWGGEEFTVLLPFMNLEEAHKVAQSILEAVRERKIPHKASKLEDKYVSVSIGVTAIKPSHEDDCSNLMKTVDMALYKAKESGRNKIEVI